jgi:hypothetical protein
MLNAFCRVAPSVRFNFLAILAAGVFLRAIVFSSRTSVEVHARRFFDFLGINPPYQIGSWYPLAGAEEIGADRFFDQELVGEHSRRYGRQVKKGCC